MMTFLGIALFFTVSSVIVGIINLIVHPFLPEQQMIRRFNKMRHSLIHDAPPGQDVRILGNVVVDSEEFISPFSKRRCVYYEAIVQEQIGKGFHVAAREVRGASFFVEDASGRALVKTENVKIEAHKDGEFTSGFMQDASVHLEEFLARHGQKSEGKTFNRTLRYRERILEPREAIAVLGRVRWEQDPEPRNAGEGYREAPKRAVMEPLADGHVWVSDVVEVAVPKPGGPAE
jgi:hypothetical protein